MIIITLILAVLSYKQSIAIEAAKKSIEASKEAIKASNEHFNEIIGGMKNV